MYSLSYGQNSFMAAKHLPKSWLCKTIGAGHNTRVWSGSRIWQLTHLELRPLLFTDNLKSLFILLLGKIPKSGIFLFYKNFPQWRYLWSWVETYHSLSLDEYAWNHSGVYSVKSGYELLRTTNILHNQKYVFELSITCQHNHV